MALSIGIDLGTPDSVAAVAGRMASVVAFPDHDGVLVGHEARAYRTINPASTVYSAKRLTGQSICVPRFSSRRRRCRTRSMKVPISSR